MLLLVLQAELDQAGELAVVIADPGQAIRSIA